MAENNPSLPGRYESPAIALASAGAINVTVNHGRGQSPRHTRWVLVCLKAELGYNTGDEATVYAYPVAGLPGTWANAAQIGLLIDTTNGNPSVVNRSTTATTNITRANWALKVYADF